MIAVKDLRAHPLDQVHRLIEPGPVILITTHHHAVPNVMTNGFNMMVRQAPALIAVTVGPWDHSYRALVETGECVVSVPTADMADTRRHRQLLGSRRRQVPRVRTHRRGR